MIYRESVPRSRGRGKAGLSSLKNRAEAAIFGHIGRKSWDERPAAL